MAYKIEFSFPSLLEIQEAVKARTSTLYGYVLGLPEQTRVLVVRVSELVLAASVSFGLGMVVGSIDNAPPATDSREQTISGPAPSTVFEPLELRRPLPWPEKWSWPITSEEVSSDDAASELSRKKEWPDYENYMTYPEPIYPPGYVGGGKSVTTPPTRVSKPTKEVNEEVEDKPPARRVERRRYRRHWRH